MRELRRRRPPSIVTGQQQLHARDAAFAAARTHTDAGDVLQLIHGDNLLALHGFQDGLDFHVVAVADEGGIQAPEQAYAALKLIPGALQMKGGHSHGDIDGRKSFHSMILLSA